MSTAPTDDTKQNAAVPADMIKNKALSEPDTGYLDDPDTEYLDDPDIDYLDASWDAPDEPYTDDPELYHQALEEEIQNVTSDVPPLHIDDTPDDIPEDIPADIPAETSRPSGVPATVGEWFFTFMCMNIPIAGWFYLLYLAFNKKKTELKNFARAFLFYKLVFLAISAVILGILIYIGLDYLDQLLAYMEML